MLAFALAAGSTGVAAQTRLVGLVVPDLLHCQQPCLSTLLDIDVEQRRVVSSPVSGITSNFLQAFDVTADGQLAIFILGSFGPSPKFLRGVDLTSFAEFRVPLGTDGARPMVFGHPARMMAFVHPSLNQPIMVADYAGLRPLPNPQGIPHGALTGMSGDGARLFVTQFDAVVTSRVIDSETGALVAVFSDLQIVASNDAGTEVYGVTASERPRALLKRIDVATGVVLGESSAGYGSQYLRDPRTGDIWERPSSIEYWIIKSGDTLAFRNVFYPPLRAGAYLLFDRDTPFAYLAGKIRQDEPVHVALLNTNSLAVELEGDIPMAGSLEALALMPRPPRVSGLSSSVIGSTVTLDWSIDVNRGVATEMLIEAGSGPGRTDLAWLRAAASSTSLIVPNVPPGTYYVPVRSANGAGAGTPSNEVVVVVAGL